MIAPIAARSSTTPRPGANVPRLMQIAARFHAPVITLIDTPGAYPGLGAAHAGSQEAA